MQLKIMTFLLILAFQASEALGQGAEFFNAGKKKEATDSQDGLNSATPTDNVGELNDVGAGVDTGGGDFPAASAPDADFDLGNASANGDELFGNGAKDSAAQGPGSFSDAFGGDAKAAPKAPPTPAVEPKAAASVAPMPAVSEPIPTINAVQSPMPPPQSSPAPQVTSTQVLPPSPPSPPAPLSIVGPPAPTVPVAQEPVSAPPIVAAPAQTEPLLIKAPSLPEANEFAGAPPVPGTMRIMADGEAPEEYAVQPGDTLFDVCDQLLDEPGYWPKLWALNPEIKNPHFIFPGMRLKFYPGDDDTPPYLQVVTEDDIIPIDKGGLDESELVAEKVIFDEKTYNEDPPIEVIGPEGVDALQDEILTAGRVFDGNSLLLHVPGFIFGAPKEPLGTVLSGREGEPAVADEQKVLVIEKSGLAAGTLYTVIRPESEVSNPSTGERVGYRYAFVANVRVNKKEKDGLCIGQVESGRLMVMPDDLVVNYISTRRTIPAGNEVGNLQTADARVIGFDYGKQEAGSLGSYVFIDKGNSEGISPGRYLPIYSTPGSIVEEFESELPTDYEMVGVMRIIDATDAGAVGYIVRASQEIRVGDRTDKG